MRKLCAFVMSVLLICLCGAVVSAEEEKYSNAGELYEAWCENLPDYICGVWSTDGGTENLTFGIQNNAAGNAGKAQMLELVENDGSLTFVYQVYGRNALLRIQEELYPYLEKDLGLISTALDEIGNCIELGILEDRKNDADTKGMIREITRKYGDAVSVVYTGQIHAVTTQNRNLRNLRMLPVGVVALILIAWVFLDVQRKRLLLVQTHGGAAVSEGAVLSAEEIAEWVKRSADTVPPELDQKILNAVNEKK